MASLSTCHCHRSPKHAAVLYAYKLLGVQADKAHASYRDCLAAQIMIYCIECNYDLTSDAPLTINSRTYLMILDLLVLAKLGYPHLLHSVFRRLEMPASQNIHELSIKIMSSWDPFRPVPAQLIAFIQMLAMVHCRAVGVSTKAALR